MEGVPGVRGSDVTVAAVTVRPALPVCPWNEAEMVVAPGAAEVAIPPVTVATPLADEVHVACEVTTCVDPSEKVAVAVNVSCVPSAMDAEDGATTIDASTTPDLTVRAALPLTPPKEAEMVALPAVTALAVRCRFGGARRQSPIIHVRCS